MLISVTVMFNLILRTRCASDLKQMRYILCHFTVTLCGCIQSPNPNRSASAGQCCLEVATTQLATNRR